MMMQGLFGQVLSAINEKKHMQGSLVAVLLTKIMQGSFVRHDSQSLLRTLQKFVFVFFFFSCKTSPNVRV